MDEKIVVLSDKDKARKRINIWHGSSSNWLNMIKELIGNSGDVFDKNIKNEIKIIIHNNNKIEYIDSGSGIPVEGIANNGRENYIALFEMPFAGSKYDSISDTVGQNGIFLYSLSMTCEDIEYYIARPNKNVYNIAYHKGDRNKELNVIGTSDKTYTRIIFSLDEEVWDKPNFTFDEICNIAQGQASLINVDIIVEDKENNKIKKYYYENGIEDYFKEKTKEKTFITDNIRIKNKSEYLIEKNNLLDKISIDLLLNFSNDSKEDIQKDFLNTADLILHGTIQDGILLGLKNIIHKWLRNNNKYDKKESGITLEDVSTGLNYICDFRGLYVEYVSQVKQQSLSPHHKIVISKVIEEFMNIYFIENPIEAQKICEQVLINLRARVNSNKARQNLKKKLEAEKKGFKLNIEGLRDCDMSNSEFEERIFIVDEGLSANSTICDSFDNRYMGALGLRGRFINSLKYKVEDVLNNVPALGIIQAMGAGIEIPSNELKKFKDIQTWDRSKLRYGKIAFLCDADAFGKGINLSLLTFVYKFMPTLLKEGRVYIVISPRYEIILKDNTKKYVYNEDEKNELIKTIGESNIKSIGIKKGLGEFDKDEFWEYVLSPKARKKSFIKINYNENESEQIKYYFDMLMGEDIDNRKKFIRDNITNINLNEME